MNNNIEIKYIAETDTFLINGELWRRETPVTPPEVKKPYFPKPKEEEKYYFICDIEDIDWHYWDDDNTDHYYYHTLNCWIDKSECEAYVKRYGIYLPDRLTLAIRRWKIAKGVEDRFDWENANEVKWCIFYNCLARGWNFEDAYAYRQPNTEYFRDIKTADKCLSDIRTYFDEQLNEWKEEK